MWIDREKHGAPQYLCCLTQMQPELDVLWFAPQVAFRLQPLVCIVFKIQIIGCNSTCMMGIKLTRQYIFKYTYMSMLYTFLTIIHCSRLVVATKASKTPVTAAWYFKMSDFIFTAFITHRKMVQFFFSFELPCGFFGSDHNNESAWTAAQGKSISTMIELTINSSQLL